MRSYRACHRRGYITRWGVSGFMVALGVVGRSPVLLVGGPVYWLASEWSVRRQLRPYRLGAREVTVTLTEDDYRTSGEDRATARTWSTFQSVERVGDYWVLRVSKAAALGLPADALDDRQTDELRDLLRRKGLLRE